MPRLDPNGIPRSGGTYALLMRRTTSRVVRIGRLGLLSLTPGVYVYVGSALGPGGLRARLGRHVRQVKKLCWHVDYLRSHTELIAVWFVTGEPVREHQWALAFTAIRRVSAPLARFGSSDCRCPAHLFWAANRLAPQGLLRYLRAIDPTHPRICEVRVP